MNDVKHYSTLESDDRQLHLFTWENSVCVCVCVCVYVCIYIYIYIYVMEKIGCKGIFYNFYEERAYI